MKTKKSFTFVVTLAIATLVVVSVVKVTSVLAQTASSTDESTLTEQTITPPEENITSEVTTTGSTTTESSATASSGPEQSSVPPAQESTSSELPTVQQSGSVPSLNLTRVNITGTKYVDYFTDGGNEYSFPSDPNIVAGFSQPNSPIPTHGDLKWTGTRGYPLYDTPSGDLEEWQYAEQADGTYIVHYPPLTYTSATSTSKRFSSQITTTNIDPSSKTLEGFTPPNQ